jgi:hypothetical protein
VNTYVVPVVDLLPSFRDFCDLIKRQVRQRLRERGLFDVLRVPTCRDGDDTLTLGPEQEDGGVVDRLAGLLTQSLSNAGENGPNWSAGRVPNNGGERAISFGDDTMLSMDRENRFEVRKQVGVVLNLSSTSEKAMMGVGRWMEN